MAVPGLEERKYLFDVCFSFAGEDREYVDQVFNFLHDRGIKVFYDKNESVEMWGKNLYDYLSDLYQNKAKYCVMFISEHYAKKHWTNLERQTAQARAFIEKGEYILPARFDDTEIPGLASTVRYESLNEFTPLQFADQIAKKVSSRIASADQDALAAAESANDSAVYPVAPTTSLTTSAPKTSLAEFKDYLAEHKFRIRLSDHMSSETEILFRSTTAEHFPLNETYSPEAVVNRVQRYESLTEPLQRRLMIGCRWGEEAQEALWIETLRRIANPVSLVGIGSYMPLWDGLRLYPALLLLYTAGISCVAYERYDNLAAIMTKPILANESSGNVGPIGGMLYPVRVMDKSVAETLLGQQRLYTPVNDYLEKTLWKMFENELNWYPRFEAAFMKFEYLLALIHGFYSSDGWVPGGNFLWKQRRSQKTIYAELDKEIANLGQNLPLLKSGLFDGTLAKLQEVKTDVDEVLGKYGGSMY